MRAPSVVFVTHPFQPIGVDYWRALTPGYAMVQAGMPAKTIRLGDDIPTFGSGAPDVLVFSQRGSSAPGRTKRLRDTFCREHGILLVADCCDDPFPEDGSPLAEKRKAADPNGWTAEEAVYDHLSAADLVTVNSPAMAEQVRRLNPNVEVLPDLAHLDHWAKWVGAKPNGRPEQITVGVAGGDTHGDDWRILAEVWPRVAEACPHVHFAVVGHQQDYLSACVPADRFHAVPWANVAVYQLNYHWIDIGCAPLLDTVWNRSKSPIRWVEYTLAGAPTVASPTVYGDVIKHGRSGFVATTVDEWVQHITHLVAWEQRRGEVLYGALDAVKRRWLLDKAALKHRAEVYGKHYRRVYGHDPKGARDAAPADKLALRSLP